METRINKFKVNLFIPGAAKSGTSALHAYLDQHPAICMSRIKEPHFFAKAADNYQLPGYDSLFDMTTGKIRYFGESSTSYLISERAIQRIKQQTNTPKFIVVLRDPLERIESHYNWLRSFQAEDRPLWDAVFADEDEIFDPENVVKKVGYNYYLEFSKYGKWLKQYIDTFGRENIHIITQEALKSDPLKTLNGCFGFLSLEKFDSLPEQEANKTRQVMSYVEPGYIKIGRRLVPGFIKSLLRKRSNVIDKIVHKHMKPQEFVKFDREQRLEMIRYFRNDLKLLQDVTGLKFDHWETNKEI